MAIQTLNCMVCKKDVVEIKEYAYMVQDDVWMAVAARNPKGYLCISCLEKRLGRKLTADDFKAQAINHPLFNPEQKSDLLKSRVGDYGIWKKLDAIYKEYNIHLKSLVKEMQAALYKGEDISVMHMDYVKTVEVLRILERIFSKGT